MPRTSGMLAVAAVLIIGSTACATTAVAPTAPPSAQSAPVTPLPPPGKPTPPSAAVGQASPSAAAADQAAPAAKPEASIVAAPAKPAAPAASAADVSAGQQLMAQKGCGGCHTVPGVPGANGKVGPDLTGVGSRPTLAGGAVQHNGPDDIKRWILDPPAVKPGTAMPKLGLSDDEATKIAAYLETLK